MLRQLRSPSTRTVLLVYACLGVGWVLLGDLIESRVPAAVVGGLGWQTAKGLAFVAISVGVLGWFGAQRDRAEARQGEQALRLRERNRLYRAMFEDSPVVKLLLDPVTGQVVDANGAAVRYYGYPMTRLRAADLRQLCAGSEEECLELIERGMAGPATLEQEHRMADGVVREVVCNVGPLELDGRPLLYVLVSDVSEQRRAELELRLLSTALEAAHNGIVLTDAEGVIQWVNPAFSAMTGYSHAEAVGSTPQELSAGFAGEEFYRQLWRTLDAGQPWQGELQIRRKDGTVYTEEQAITPVRDGSGRIRHFIAIKQDVTEKRAVREALELRAQQQAALAELGQAALSDDDLSSLMQRAVDDVAEVLGVEFVNVLYLAPGRDMFVLEAGRGWREGVVGHLEVSADTATMAAYVIDRAGPVISADIPAETRFPPPALLLDHGVRGSVAVPIEYGRETFGILGAHSSAPGERDPTDVAFMQGVANVLAASLRHRRFADALRESNRQLRSAYDATIEGWAQALDLRDHETEGHTRRVTDLSVALGRALGFGERDIETLRRGAMLHDIGKMGVPDAILHKAGPLTDEEWAIMRTHPTLAKEMLGRIGFLGDAVEVPYCHHERWDGSGYPRGLAGEEIPLSARVFAVVDVYDALTSDRPYRAAWAPEKALEYIEREAGTHFDPAVVRAFAEMISGGVAADA